MKDLFTLQTLEQVKALTDPLRQRLLGAFCQGPLTTKQAADLLGEKPTRLYHHVTTLEQAGLIRIVETRQNRGTVEKYYQAVATRFSVDRSLFEVAPESDTTASGILLIVNALEDTLAHFQRNVPSTKSVEDQLVFVHAQNLCLTPDQIADLRATVCTWLEQQVEECAADTAGKSTSHTLTLVLYPASEGNEGAD